MTRGFGIFRGSSFELLLLHKLIMIISGIRRRRFKQQIRNIHHEKHDQFLFKALSHCATLRATSFTTHCETSCTKHCTSVHTWQRARFTAQLSGKSLEIVAESGTVFYFQQWFLQLVSQRFRPLQGMSHCAMYRATCLAMALRDKLHETLQSVTAPLRLQEIICLYYIHLTGVLSLVTLLCRER